MAYDSIRAVDPFTIQVRKYLESEIKEFYFTCRKYSAINIFVMEV